MKKLSVIVPMLNEERTIARTLEARGVKTPAGRSQWQPVQVSRLLAA